MNTETNIFITNPTNIRYLTGFVGLSPTEREAYVLIVGKQTYLFVNALYLEEAKRLEHKNLQVLEINRDQPITQQLSTLAKKLDIQTIQFEETNLTVAELSQLQKVLTNISLKPVQNFIEQKRQIKTKEEIANIKKAAQITDLCFSYIKKRIRLGMTESRLAFEIEGFLRFKGAQLAFAPIVAFNEHSALPHYDTRGNSPLRKNSLILLDFGARVNGYCADMTRVVFLGSPSQERIKIYTTVLEANKAALAILATGQRDGQTLDIAARKVIIDAGFLAYPHSLGHAVGLDIHEAPRLSYAKPETLQENQVITIEPGIYIPDSSGVRIEDLVLLKRDGIEILSKSEKEITIL